MTEHRYAFEQFVEPINEKFPRRVQIVALCNTRCAEHSAPIYGCVHGDDHFQFCEEVLKPLSDTQKRRMN